MWKCWNGLGNTEKGKRSVVSKVINNVIDYCRICCAGEGVVAASPLSKPQDKQSRARASSAKPAQAREGRSALLCQLLACRAGIPLSPGTIPVPILSSIAVSTNKALCTFHLDLTFMEVPHMVLSCPNKRHLPTFTSPGASTFNHSNIGKSSYMFGKLSLVMAYFQLMSSPVRNVVIQRLSPDS